MEINIKKINKNARIPTRGSNHAAGYDLYACVVNDIDIPAHSTVKIGTGVGVSIPDGYFGAVFARSGIASRQGLRPSNCVGVIDSDYRGEIIVAMHNDSDIRRTVNPEERIAQLVIIPYTSAEFKEVDNLDDTERGEDGFGSTGYGSIIE